MIVFDIEARNMEQPEEHPRQQGGAQRTMTILESGKDESGPSDLLGDIVQQDHDRQCRQKAVNSSNQFWARARSGAKPYRIVTAIKKISSGTSKLIRYQRSGMMSLQVPGLVAARAATHLVAD
jgi:hypothetical protein